MILQINPLKWFGGKPAAAVVVAASAASPPVDFAAQAKVVSSSAEAVETEMGFESVVLSGVKDVEVGVADAVKIFSSAAAKAPAAVTALTALAGAIDKALIDVASAATNPSLLMITLPGSIADFKAIWGDGKTLLASIGVK